MLQSLPIAVHTPCTLVDHDAPLCDAASAIQATTGDPLKPALHVAVQLPPIAVAAQTAGKAPFVGLAGTPAQKAVPVAVAQSQHRTGRQGGGVWQREVHDVVQCAVGVRPELQLPFLQQEDKAAR